MYIYIVVLFFRILVLQKQKLYHYVIKVDPDIAVQPPDDPMSTGQMQHRGQSEARPEDHEPADGTPGGELCRGGGTLRQYGQLDQEPRQTSSLWTEMWQ